MLWLYYRDRKLKDSLKQIIEETSIWETKKGGVAGDVSTVGWVATNTLALAKS